MPPLAAAVTCISGPPWVPGKMVELSFFSISGLARAGMTPPRGPRESRASWSSKTSASSGRIGIEAGGNQAGDMRHVDKKMKHRPYLGDGAKSAPSRRTRE